jgi:hypothetical protein
MVSNILKQMKKQPNPGNSKSQKKIIRETNRPAKFNNYIRVRLYTEDKLKIKEKALLSGIRLSDYIRKCALDYKIIPKADYDLRSQINRIGVNINQVTRKINSFSDIKNNHKILDELVELKNELLSILSKIS